MLCSAVAGHDVKMLASLNHSVDFIVQAKWTVNLYYVHLFNENIVAK